MIDVHILVSQFTTAPEAVTSLAVILCDYVKQSIVSFSLRFSSLTALVIPLSNLSLFRRYYTRLISFSNSISIVLSVALLNGLYFVRVTFSPTDLPYVDAVSTSISEVLVDFWEELWRGRFYFTAYGTGLEQGQLPIHDVSLSPYHKMLSADGVICRFLGMTLADKLSIAQREAVC